MEIEYEVLKEEVEALLALLPSSWKRTGFEGIALLPKGQFHNRRGTAFPGCPGRLESLPTGFLEFVSQPASILSCIDSYAVLI